MATVFENYDAARTAFINPDVYKRQAVTYCEDCHQTYGTVEHGKVCPFCSGGNTYLVAGNEFNIKEIEAC